MARFWSHPFVEAVAVAAMVLLRITPGHSATVTMDGNLHKEVATMVVSGIASGSGNGIMQTMDLGMVTLRSHGNESATVSVTANAIVNVNVNVDTNTTTIITAVTTMTDALTTSLGLNKTFRK